MKVLIADDNQDILDTTALVLEIDGHEVLTVKDPRLIIETCRAEQPDLILQDANMPGFDLLDHLEAVAADSAVNSLSFVIFSGKDPLPAAMEYPFVVGSLPKPFDLAGLRAWTQRVQQV